MKSEKMVDLNVAYSFDRNFDLKRYLADIIASVVKSPDQLHHVAHPVLWAGVKHVDIWVEERVPWADGNEGITTCSSSHHVMCCCHQPCNHACAVIDCCWRCNTSALQLCDAQAQEIGSISRHSTHRLMSQSSNSSDMRHKRSIAQSTEHRHNIASLQR